MNTGCLATPQPPSNRRDIKEKWTQLEENEEPLTIMRWSGLTTLIIMLAIADSNM
jgi:hypothetical protein